MAAAQRMKTPDKQEICKKVLTLLKKTYAGVAPKQELPVLETLLYANCLENSTPEQAEQVYARVLNGFHDLNEVRVSSIYELQRLFHDMDQPEWKALRIKNILQYVFETTYAFDFEVLKRKSSVELATKQLGKIHALSPFIRAFVLQNSLGSHVLPIDDRMLAAVVWLGLAEPGSDADHASEGLRSFVRKADAQLFCHLLRCVATDPKYVPTFAVPPDEDDDAVSSAYERLDDLIRRGPRPIKKEVSKKPAAPAPAAAGRNANGAKRDAKKDPPAASSKKKLPAKPAARQAKKSK